MPIYLVTIKFNSEGEIDLTPAFQQNLAEQVEVQEIVLCKLGRTFEAYVVADGHIPIQDQIVNCVKKEFDLPETLHVDSIEGVEVARRFLEHTAGKSSDNFIEFRKQFLLARELGMVGARFNRLYQRGVWLSEKIRLVLNLQRKAITAEAVISELASKIFGDLRDHTALIVSDSRDCEKFVRKLYEKNLGHLQFAANGAVSQDLSKQFQGELISESNFGSALAGVDILLIFEPDIIERIRNLKISKIMNQRKNAPLFWASLFDSDLNGNKTIDLSKFYNVYSYNKKDVDTIIHENLKEHRKASEIVDDLISKETDGFFEWLQSDEEYHLGNIVGRSTAMQQILDLIAKISQTDISVLIDGESGTGKELVAKAIHEHSTRVNGPFIVVNCGALPENLLESELFGHVKGAFTGASNNKIGLIQAANHGTIFLDEIGETSPTTQVKLLRFLQEGEIKPVGSNETRKLDVRVITATNRDLAKMVEDGLFRQDLYYRLNVIQITIPPLRDRREDILPLARFFIKKCTERMHKSVYGLDQKAEQLLQNFDWMGNVRELENAIERAVALSSGQILTPEDLPPTLELHNSHATPADSEKPITLKQMEKQHIAQTLQEHNWNYELVTKILGIGRTTLWRKMKEYEISN